MKVTEVDREAASKFIGPRMTASGLVRLSYEAAAQAFASHREDERERLAGLVLKQTVLMTRSEATPTGRRYIREIDANRLFEAITGQEPEMPS